MELTNCKQCVMVVLHREKEIVMERFKASVQASEFAGESYGAYIQGFLEERVDEGSYTLEFARSADLGDLLHGNDGE